MVRRATCRRRRLCQPAGSYATDGPVLGQGSDPSKGFFGSPESRRDPGLFHGLIRPVPASPGPKLCTIWQPTKSRNAARFPVFYSGNKSTTLLSGRVSPCTREPPDSFLSQRRRRSPRLHRGLPRLRRGSPKLRRRSPSGRASRRVASTPSSLQRRPDIPFPPSVRSPPATSLPPSFRPFRLG